MHLHPDMPQPDKIPDCTSCIYSQFQLESANQLHLHIEMPVLLILSACIEIFLHLLPTVPAGNHTLQKYARCPSDLHILSCLQYKNLTASDEFPSAPMDCLLQGLPLLLPAFLPRCNNDKIPAKLPRAISHLTADYFHNVPVWYPKASAFP